MSLSNLIEENVAPIMHGENFLLPVTTTPKGTWKQYDKFIVGHSETGHHHVLNGEVEVLESANMDGQMFVRLLKVTDLVHQKTTEKHETIAVEPGIYQVTHKTEYDPFAKVVRRVFD